MNSMTTPAYTADDLWAAFTRLGYRQANEVSRVEVLAEHGWIPDDIRQLQDLPTLRDVGNDMHGQMVLSIALRITAGIAGLGLPAYQVLDWTRLVYTYDLNAAGLGQSRFGEAMSWYRQTHDVPALEDGWDLYISAFYTAAGGDHEVAFSAARDGLRDPAYLSLTDRDAEAAVLAEAAGLSPNETSAWVAAGASDRDPLRALAGLRRSR